MPPIIVQLIAAVVGEVFRQILLNLPALEDGLRQISTSSATEAQADPQTAGTLQQEINQAISAGEVPAP